MVLPPTLHRHELANSIHATFLHPTARFPPLFHAVASGARRTSKARSCSPTTWILGAYPFSSRCTTKSIAKKSPPGSLPPAVPLAITRTFRPWTHTSDDSYIYQLSLVVATATVQLLYLSSSFYFIRAKRDSSFFFLTDTSQKKVRVCSTNLGFSVRSANRIRPKNGIPMAVYIYSF